MQTCRPTASRTTLRQTLPGAPEPRALSARVSAPQQVKNVPLAPRAPFLAPAYRRVLVAAGTDSPAPSEPERNVCSVSEEGQPRDAVLGVLGGGQLGRMMALAAGNMGVSVRVLDPSAIAPAAVAAEQTHGSFADMEDVLAFAEGVDVLTVEIEHIDADGMQAVLDAGKIVVEPTPDTLRVIQDKFLQKQHFEAAGVPLPEYADVPDATAAKQIVGKFGLPLMLKSKRNAYDGRGNYVVESAADMEAGVAALGGYERGVYAEKWAPFVKELAVMVVRGQDGTLVPYPVAETVHKDSILSVTDVPADVPPGVLASADSVARKAVGALQGAGIFGVEMFLMPDGRVLLNEVAPRPHNSGHYTMDACATSQFENHVRAVMGWPIGDTSLLPPHALMLNLLGEADGDEGLACAHETMGRAYATPGASVHWYDKEGCRTKRKIGHINIVGSDRAECLERLAAISPEAAARLGAADDTEKPRVGIIMGSDSDLPTMKAAAQVLDDFGVACEVTVVSAHRTPERMLDYARSAASRGLGAIIAGAGGAAHLPGMVAAMTALPVIGVPVIPAGAHLDGVDALLSIVQMPRGVPVATVAVGNAANAGLLAVRILAASDPALLAKMVDYQEGMTQTVLGKAERLENVGWRDY